MEVKIRKTTIEDSDYIFNLVNEPTTKQVSFKQETISRELHDSWFLDMLKNESVLYFIIENIFTKESVGQLRVNLEGTVSLTIAEKYRGKGYAKSSIKELISYLETTSELPEINVLYAYIREQNIGSSKTFVSNDFKKTGKTFLYGHECIIHSLKLERP